MSPSAPRRSAPPAPPPEWDLEALQALLDRVPAPLEPLDVSMLDGFLCGLLVQPAPVPPERWLPYVTDGEARPLPRGFSVEPLHRLVRRRYDELDAAIARRQWFDPWVFELEDDEAPDDDEAPPAIEAVYPWVAGFALAMDNFPALAQGNPLPLVEPLALLYRHLGPDDLEDADDLREAMEALAPPEDLADAVEDLVTATLLLADVSRPLAAPGRPGPSGGARPGPRGGPRGRRH